MPRQRSPVRDTAFQMWRDSDCKKPLKDIASELGVTDIQIRKWKNVDKWNERVKSNVTKSVKSNVTKRKNPGGAPKGNKNAAGNIGGKGGPFGNKKAVVTGEHETIAWDVLDDNERLLYARVSTEEIESIDRTIRMMEIRERRMLLRIKQLQEGPAMVESLEIESEQDNPQFGRMRGNTTNRESAVDRIQRIEEALTRVQEKKGKYIELRAKLVPSSLRDELERLRIEKLKAEIAKLNGSGDGEDSADDGFMDALKGKASEVWNGDDDDGGSDSNTEET